MKPLHAPSNKRQTAFRLEPDILDSRGRDHALRATSREVLRAIEFEVPRPVRYGAGSHACATEEETDRPLS